MLTTLNKCDILLDDERRTDFLSKSNMPQSRVEKPNRFSLIARNAAFLLEGKMPKGMRGFQKGGTSWNKGIPHTKKARKNMSKAHKGIQLGSKNPNWRGGIHKTKDGYICIKTSKVEKGGNAYTLEHRLVIEKIIGRKLKSSEIVHHVNGIRNDNRPENLMLFRSNGVHKKFEMIQEGMKEGEILFDGKNYKEGGDDA